LPANVDYVSESPKKRLVYNSKGSIMLCFGHKKESMMEKILIKNGTVITPTDTIKTDLLIEGE